MWSSVPCLFRHYCLPQGNRALLVERASIAAAIAAQNSFWHILYSIALKLLLLAVLQSVTVPSRNLEDMLDKTF